MKQRKAFVLLTAACFAAFTFMACSKSDKKDDAPQTKETAGNIPGMGKAEGTPQGTALTFPAGVTLSTRPLLGEICDTTYEVGSGGLVEICMAFVNNNATDVTLTLPAGLVVISETTEYQHGLLIQNATIVLKAKRTTQVGVNFWCLNASRAPSSGSAVYKLGPVTNSVLIGQLCEQLKNKRTARHEYTDDTDYYVASNAIQMLIWGYTDGDGFTSAELAEQLKLIANR